jgi:hypothetical protein
MTYYRILSNLTLNGNIIKSNTVQNIDLSEKSIGRLISNGHIALVSTPPLSELLNWDIRAIRLGNVGIMTGGELLECDTQSTAQLLNMSVELLEQWKLDLIDDFLIVKQDKYCCGGS